MVISIFIQSIPIIVRGETSVFYALMLVYIISGWLFAFYPFGGWSHSAFHIVLAIAPVIIAPYTTRLPVSQERMECAARCAVLSQMRGEGLIPQILLD